jgi:hypothetical protein
MNEIKIMTQDRYDEMVINILLALQEEGIVEILD